VARELKDRQSRVQILMTICERVLAWLRIKILSFPIDVYVVFLLRSVISDSISCYRHSAKSIATPVTNSRSWLHDALSRRAAMCLSLLEQPVLEGKAHIDYVASVRQLNSHYRRLLASSRTDSSTLARRRLSSSIKIAGH